MKKSSLQLVEHARRRPAGLRIGDRIEVHQKSSTAPRNASRFEGDVIARQNSSVSETGHGSPAVQVKV